MRKCKKCGEEKELEKFRRQQIWFTHTCKLCYAKQYRTGKPNLTRFKKGHIPWIKGKKINAKIIKKTKRIRSPGTSKYTKRPLWTKQVKERDGNKCRICAAKEDVHAHHIIPWKICEEKRYDIENGITLCRSCHSREERKIEMARGQYNLKNLK